MRAKASGDCVTRPTGLEIGDEPLLTVSSDIAESTKASEMGEGTEQSLRTNQDALFTNHG